METLAPAPARLGHRLVGVDVARAVALLGVVTMNYTERLNAWDLAGRGVGEGPGWLERLLHAYHGPLTTRFAATFVTLAGVGITLLTARSRAGGDPDAVRADRWRLRRRGVLLIAVGYGFEWVWSGQILSYYGAYLLVASFLFTWPTRRLLVLAGLVVAASGALVPVHTDPMTWSWLTSVESDSPRNLVFNTVVNGTHPLVPWFSFVLLGMVVGRLELGRAEVRRRLAVAGLAALAAGYATSTVLGRVLDGSWQFAVRTSIFPYLPLYAVVTAGSSLAAVAVLTSLAERFRSASPTRWLALAGQMTLTVYLAHAFALNWLVDRFDLDEPVGLVPALAVAWGFWAIVVPLAALWRTRLGLGPAERVYRAFGG